MSQNKNGIALKRRKQLPEEPILDEKNIYVCVLFLSNR